MSDKVRDRIALELLGKMLHGGHIYLWSNAATTSAVEHAFSLADEFLKQAKKGRLKKERNDTASEV